MESVVKSILFIPQTAIGPPLRALIFEISHFDISGFKKKNEKKIKKKKKNKTSQMEFSFFKKNLVSLVYVE